MIKTQQQYQQQKQVSLYPAKDLKILLGVYQKTSKVGLKYSIYFNLSHYNKQNLEIQVILANGNCDQKLSH